MLPGEVSYLNVTTCLSAVFKPETINCISLKSIRFRLLLLSAVDCPSVCRSIVSSEPRSLLSKVKTESRTRVSVFISPKADSRYFLP